MSSFPINTLQIHLLSSELDGILVSNPSHIQYLTGFAGVSHTERESILFVGQEFVYLVVPRIYEELAHNLVKKVSFPLQVIVNTERLNLIPCALSSLPSLRHIGVETYDLTVDEYHEITQNFSGKISPILDTIFDLRIIKTGAELENISQAVAITDKTWKELVHSLRSVDYSQLTEIGLIDRIRTISTFFGGEGFGFEPIVASGKASSEPHYVSHNRPLQKGHLLLVDLGIRYHGYTGDLTRCVFLGKAPQPVQKMYQIVYEAHDAALVAVKHQAVTGQVHQAAVDIFENHGVSRYFVHSLGHGVGLDIHERPYLRHNSQELLKEHMVVTIEPGLYFPGEYGIRIEDFIVVTRQGYQQLSRSAPKRLQEI